MIALKVGIHEWRFISDNPEDQVTTLDDSGIIETMDQLVKFMKSSDIVSGIVKISPKLYYTLDRDLVIGKHYVVDVEDGSNNVS